MTEKQDLETLREQVLACIAADLRTALDFGDDAAWHSIKELEYRSKTERDPAKLVVFGVSSFSMICKSEHVSRRAN